VERRKGDGSGREWYGRASGDKKVKTRRIKEYVPEEMGTIVACNAGGTRSG
jgi:hypothetical protein